MKRLVSILSVCALLALLLAATVSPAMAQKNNHRFFNNNDHFFNNNDHDFDNDFDNGVVNQGIGQESESGDVNVEFSVSSSGDFAQQCVAPLQFANSGNLQNAQGFVQYQSDTDDVEFEGNSFEFFTGPGADVSTTCDQAVQQSAAASS